MDSDAPQDQDQGTGTSDPEAPDVADTSDAPDAGPADHESAGSAPSETVEQEPTGQAVVVGPEPDEPATLPEEEASLLGSGRLDNPYTGGEDGARVVQEDYR